MFLVHLKFRVSFKVDFAGVYSFDEISAAELAFEKFHCYSQVHLFYFFFHFRLLVVILDIFKYISFSFALTFWYFLDLAVPFFPLFLYSRF